ncbi:MULTISPECIES: glycosyltransferase [Sphingobacterium]|uniref:glycosyltransferase n=1 Tax=Sphingobacterium TaxID=28453 RepID=UPI00104B29F4|nr:MULTISPECIES: glycosyltransferase [Sphingobacterium]MCW2262042.1 glycosyltransferase involved in cell wall biosynthesis [Sphingobacterium kitahiroshimense]NJI75001.1 glycosyltransferase family 4 protein [Sphingobacterium sp. B16(2022)]TCR13210.1 glycosyltransferase involved in cell wall biosynthesis [Sphingobacterium sp. JUb78]
MKALFVHDHIFYKKSNDFYSPGGLPVVAWDRYLASVDQLFVVSRGNVDDHKEGLVKSSRPNVEFDLLYKVKGGLDYYRFRKEIEAKLRFYIQKVDFVIIRLPSTIGYFAYLLCKELKVPFVSEVVGCAWDSTWNYGTFLIKLQAPIRYFQMRKVVKESFAVTYVTEFFLQNRYPTQSNIVISASNVQIPEILEETKLSHINFLKRSEDERIIKIGIIGNLNVKYKGFDVAMRALHELKVKMPELKFEFYLVGGGVQDYILSLIEKFNLNEECKIVGRLKAGSEIFQFLDGLDLYIHPSKQEGLPRSVIEAMSRACPVLASSVAGIPELIADKYLHHPGDYRKLLQDLIYVLTDLEVRVSMSNSNFKKSKDYVQSRLESIRKDFFQRIVDQVKLIKESEISNR